MAALAASTGPIPHIGFSYCYPHNGMPPMNGFKAPSPTSSSSASASGNASPTQEHRLPEKLSETNLYIRGLSAETTDQDLHKMCEKFGKIVSTKAIVDNETSKCKGYGFVDFENPDSARKAVDKLQAEGKLVQMAKKQEEDPTNIYFSNLPDWIGDKSLREMLDPYGEVVSTRILRHPGQNGSEGRSKGVGFARMHLKEQCEKIIEKFNGQPLTDPNNPAKATAKPLLVKFADGGPKKKKNHQLNITTNFRRDDMMMETHGLPLAWHPMALPAYTPNVPTASYSPYLPSFQAPFAQVPVGDVNFLNQGYPMPFAVPQPYPIELAQNIEQSVEAVDDGSGQSQNQVLSAQNPSASVHQMTPIYYQQVA